MNVTQEQEIARYVDRVRQALADLPPTIRDELVEDLPEHLAEVAAEASGPLGDQLGPPDVYAAELRAAAGLDAPSAKPNLDDQIAAIAVKVRRRLRTLDTKAGPIIGYAKVSDFLRLLRPAWWVLRGYLAVMLVTVVLGGRPHGLLPELGDSVLGGLMMLAVAVVASIWLGRGSARFSRWPRLLVGAGTAVTALFGTAMLLDGMPSGGGYYEYGPVADTNPYSHVRDVYVYDSEGRLVEGARLFDQDGQPIRMGYPDCADADYLPSGAPVWRGYPYCPQNAPFRFPTASPSPTEVPTPAPSGSGSSTPSPAESILPSPAG